MTLFEVAFPTARTTEKRALRVDCCSTMKASEARTVNVAAFWSKPMRTIGSGCCSAASTPPALRQRTMKAVRKALETSGINRLSGMETPVLLPHVVEKTNLQRQMISIEVGRQTLKGIRKVDCRQGAAVQ